MFNKKAFTLIEIVVSIPILLILVISLLDFLIYNLQSQNRIKNDFMLNELAKEGIDAITYMRDANYVKGSLYDAGINTGIVGEEKKYILYYYDYDRSWNLQALELSGAEGIDACIIDNNAARSCAIYKNNEFFIQNKEGSFSPEMKTNFYRLITIKKIDSYHFVVSSETVYKDSILIKNKVKLVKEIWDIK